MVMIKVWINEIMKCELIMGVMGLTEEVLRFNSKCSTMQSWVKLLEALWSATQPARSLQGRSSEQTECNQKLHVTRSTKLSDRAMSLMLLGCYFWLFKYLRLFHYHLFIALMYLMLFSVISPINRELSYTHQIQPLSQTHSLCLSLTQL